MHRNTTLHKDGLFIVSPSTASLPQRSPSTETSGDKMSGSGENKTRIVEYKTNTNAA
jgi:hypothetical protein